MNRHRPQGRPHQVSIIVNTGLVALAACVVAAPATAQQRAYNIPPSTLEDALSSFGREAGILLSFSPDSTARLRSAGLQGNHTIEQGLEALLAGTGLRATRQPNGSYLLSKAPAAAPTTVAGNTFRCAAFPATPAATAMACRRRNSASSTA